MAEDAKQALVLAHYHCKRQHAAFWVMQVQWDCGNRLFLILCCRVCLMILWERRGTTFPVAFSHHCCRAVKRPACSKIKWGVERIGLICKAIGCREGRKIITLHRKTKCLLNHFKQYRTMQCAPLSAPQNKNISWGKQLNNQMKFNKLIIITTLSKTFGRPWWLSS